MQENEIVPNLDQGQILERKHGRCAEQDQATVITSVTKRNTVCNRILVLLHTVRMGHFAVPPPFYYGRSNPVYSIFRLLLLLLLPLLASLPWQEGYNGLTSLYLP